MTDDEILEIDFYDLCGCAALWMSSDEKINYYKRLFNIQTIKMENQNKWTKVNHGGAPMKNEITNPRAVFIGRFQPLHFGHTSLFKQKLDEGTPVLIMVRDMPADERNPFTTQQTVDMIKKYHASKLLDVEVMIIPDIESVNYGRGVGYEVNEFAPVGEITNVSATKIRESIKIGNDDWKSMVDESIQSDVIEYLTENDLIVSK